MKFSSFSLSPAMSAQAIFVLCRTRHDKRETRQSSEKMYIHHELATKFTFDNISNPFLCARASFTNYCRFYYQQYITKDNLLQSSLQGSNSVSAVTVTPERQQVLKFSKANKRRRCINLPLNSLAIRCGLGSPRALCSARKCDAAPFLPALFLVFFQSKAGYNGCAARELHIPA